MKRTPTPHRPPRRLQASQIRFSPSAPEERDTGLLGFLSFVVNDSLAVDGVALRRTAEGRLTLAYPARKDRLGRLHHHLRPLDDQTRRDLELQVIGAIRLGAEA